MNTGPDYYGTGPDDLGLTGADLLEEAPRPEVATALDRLRAAGEKQGAPKSERRADGGAATAPPLVKIPGSSIFYVSAAGGGWIPADGTTLRSELAKHHREVPLFLPTGNGDKMRHVGTNELYERHGRRCDRIIYDLTQQRSSYTPSEDGGGELLIACGARPSIEPAYHAEVDQWLRRLGGPLADKLIDWLATCTDLTWPTAAPYLHGPKGAGKGMFAAAVARLWGRQTIAYSQAIGQFNADLRHCPVVLLDEGCAPPMEGSAAFRSLVGETQRTIEEKYRPLATLKGAVRLIVCANNMDALRLREALTPEDEAAIGERILFVRIPGAGPGRTDAGDYLAGLGGRGHTRAWVEDPDTGEAGAIPRHIEWLTQTREVQHGDRFAVAGEAGAWLRNAGLRGGMAQEVLTAIARAAADGVDDMDASARPVWWRPGVALVNPSNLHRWWTRLTHQPRVPNLTTLGNALNVIAVGESRLSGEGRTRPRVKHIPAERVIEVADMLGIGDTDAIRARFGCPTTGG